MARWVVLSFAFVISLVAASTFAPSDDVSANSLATAMAERAAFCNREPGGFFDYVWATATDGTRNVKVPAGEKYATLRFYVYGQSCSRNHSNSVVHPSGPRSVTSLWSVPGLVSGGYQHFSSPNLPDQLYVHDVRVYVGDLSGQRTYTSSIDATFAYTNGRWGAFIQTPSATWTITIVRTNTWATTPTTRIQSARNSDVVGQNLGFEHRLRNNGPHATDKSISYATRIVRVAPGRNGVTASTKPTITQVLQAYDAHSSSNPTRLKTKDDYSAISSGKAANTDLLAFSNFTSRAEARHTLVQADAGKWICSYITVNPASYNSSGWTRSTPACKYIPNTYTLTPSITTPPPQVVEPSGPSSVRGTVAKSGNATTSSPTDVWYTRIIYRSGQTVSTKSGTSATVGSCAYYGVTDAARCESRGQVNNTTFTASRTMALLSDTVPDDFEPGDRLCYGISVRGHNTATGASKSQAHHSALRCTVVGKKPKVHVTGGDLYVGRGAASSSEVKTSVSKGAPEQPAAAEIDTPQTAFSGLWNTGVSDAKSKLTSGYDPHWKIDRVYNTYVSASTDLCQWAATGTSGTPLQKIPKTSSSTTIAPSIITEHDGGVGTYTSKNTAITGNLIAPFIFAREGWISWNKIVPNAAWIGQNRFGQNYSSSSCKDPTYDYTGDEYSDRANVYVFKLRDGFSINDTNVKLETARVYMAGAVDNQVKFYVNGHELGDWQRPLWGPTSSATSTTGGPGVFKYGKNDLEIHVRSTYSHTGLLIDDLRIEAKSTPEPEPSPYYGSWGEYGVVAAGRVRDMSSAAGYANGTKETDFCKLSLLTFSNTNAVSLCTSSTVGGYKLPLSTHTVAEYYNAQSATTANRADTSVTPAGLAAGVHKWNTTVGTLTLNAGELSGKTVVVYAPAKNVVIAGNLTYRNGSYINAGQIPQLIIIARNITINSGVSTVDAWLVSKVSGQGNIYTCNSAAAALRTTGACSGKLTVNGPVISNKLHMLRTAGAGSGADAPNAAEVFNFRPDAYLWGMSQNTTNGRIPTAAITELPPRF